MRNYILAAYTGGPEKPRGVFVTLALDLTVLG